tara:strand:+ start:146 stop:412 length:267 start_codon:yes stop_codon:yes gene_type:complete
MKMKNIIQRRRCLYACAEKGFTHEETCVELEGCFLEPVDSKEWLLWVNYYYPMTRTNPFLKNEIINNNKTLSWLIRKMSERNTKDCLS